MCGAGDDASYICFGETKDKYFNRSLRYRTEICVLIRSSTYRLHRFQCLIGPGFRYPTLATSGFFKGVLIWLNFSMFTVNVDWPTVSENSFKQSHSRTFTTPSNTQQCFITESFSIFEEIGRVDDSETHSFTYASLKDLLPPTGGLVSYFVDTDKTILLYYLVE